MALHGSRRETPRRGPKWLLVLLGVLLLGAISLLDYATGVEFGVLPLYLIPVSLVTWTAGRRAGIAAAALATVGWETADTLAGRTYSNAGIDAWNILTQFIGFSVVSFLIGAQKAEIERERAVSRSDPLTGVANVRAFHESAAAELSRARRYRRPLGFAYLDIDDFKEINDTMGHKLGDDLLVRFAQIMRDSTRTNDLVARLGGDEFAVLFPEADEEAVRAAVKKLQAELRAASREFGREVTASIGALSWAEAPDSVDEIIGPADALMYEVKSAGKNGVRFESVISGQRASALDR